MVPTILSVTLNGYSVPRSIICWPTCQLKRFIVEAPTRQAVRSALKCAVASDEMPQSGHITSIDSGSTARLGNCIGNLVVDAAEPALGDDGDHVGRRCDPLFVGFGQRIGEAGLVVARDPHRRGAIGKI